MITLDEKTTYIDEPDSQCWVISNYVPVDESKQLFEHFKTSVPWIQHVLYKGTQRERKQARLSCSMGKSYAYSGSVHPESPWNDEIYRLMLKVNKDFGCNFNSCLVNYYRDGSDSISAHSDERRALDSNGQVVSLSFGAQREMVIRSKSGHRETLYVPLPPGSLFMMTGKEFQNRYTHAIEKAPKSLQPRISLTFRCFRETNFLNTTKDNQSVNQSVDQPSFF